MTTRAEDGGDRSVGSRWCEGYTLLDPLGQTLGCVERIFCNRAGEPQYIRVRGGLFGKRLVLIPVMDVAIDHGTGPQPSVKMEGVGLLLQAAAKRNTTERCNR